MTRQPSFLLEENNYIEKQLPRIPGCLCYEFVPNREIILIPNNSIELLWNIDKKELYCFSYIRQQEWFKMKGDRLFGLHIEAACQCDFDRNELEAFMERTGEFSSFKERAAYCNEKLAKVLHIKQRHPLICHAVKKIEETKGKAVVETIAAEYGYTSRHMERLFLQNFYYGPKRFCQYIRLLNAVTEIVHLPERTIASNIDNFGYSDQSHFQREFKSYTGMTPVQFMKWYKKKDEQL